MNPQTQFCHNPACRARGQMGQGNIVVHSHVEQRYRCQTCGHTFAATTGTPFYRVHTAADVVTIVLTLLCHGCPIPAIVAAFGLDERTVAAWVTRAGRHCQQVHQHVVQQGQVDLQHVQADELWVTRVGRRVWMAMALAVPSRLWLGGCVSPQWDRVLITTLVQMVRSCARSLAILVCVDGLASSVTAFLRVFRYPVRTDGRGRPRLVLEPGLLLGQVVKRYARRRVVCVEQRVVRGTAEAIATVLAATGSGTGINTASIERLNATFRASLTPLVRRGRAIAHTETMLTAGMYLVGCAYNFCWLHESLRVAAPVGAPWKWQERTPAMAAALTGHRGTRCARWRSQVPLPPWVAPKRRRRAPRQARQQPMAVAV
jgi:transposase-like protein